MRQPNAILFVLLATSCAAHPPPRLTGHEFAIDVERNLVYARHAGVELAVDVWRPRCEGPHPVALVVHGGGWRIGDRNYADAAVLARALAQEGIAAVSLSHRHAPRHVHPAQIEDLRAAIRWVRAHASGLGLDPARVAAVGTSSGGHLVALLATQDEPADPRERTKPDCVVAISAPFDLLPNGSEPATTIQINLVRGYLGLDAEPDVDRKIALLHERGRDASPLAWVSPDDPPFLVIHGDTDTVVPVAQARRMVAALRTAGVACGFVEVPQGGHAQFLFGRSDWLDDAPPFWIAVREFLQENLLRDR